MQVSPERMRQINEFRMVLFNYWSGGGKPSVNFEMPKPLTGLSADELRALKIRMTSGPVSMVFGMEEVVAVEKSISQMMARPATTATPRDGEEIWVEGKMNFSPSDADILEFAARFWPPATPKNLQ